LSAIANRSRLESFSGERGGWLWDTIEEGLGTYLYGFSEDGMRMDSRLYGIHTKEYPITIGLCANIRRKSHYKRTPPLATHICVSTSSNKCW